MVDADPSAPATCAAVIGPHSIASPCSVAHLSTDAPRSTRTHGIDTGRALLAGLLFAACRRPALLLFAMFSDHFITLRSEEHTSELQSLMRISSAVFCLKKTN